MSDEELGGIVGILNYMGLILVHINIYMWMYIRMNDRGVCRSGKIPT